MRIKTEKEIITLAEGGKILSQTLDALIKMLKPGITTADLEEAALTMMAKAGAKPAFKGYRSSKKDKPFPTALCISLNHEVVHGPALPSRTINDGDIVSIDIGLEYKGLFTDMAKTVAVGNVPGETKRLIKTTEKSLELALKKVKPGLSLYELGKTIEDYIEDQGFAVVKQLVGHGVGHAVHEAPQIPNYAVDNNKNELLVAGMVIAIEPMVNIGTWEVDVADDDTTIITADGSLSAHFEHTVAVTKDGCQILTR